MAVLLTAKIGTIQYNGHKETWYNLNMRRVVARSDEDLNLTDAYWVRDDGVKMYGPFVIVAADKTIPRYSLVDTSLGIGITLDTHTTGDPNHYDIATDW